MITLNVNELNAPIKRQDDSLDKKTRLMSIYKRFISDFNRPNLRDRKYILCK